MRSYRFDILQQLRTSKEPSIRYQILRFIDGKDPHRSEMQFVQDEIKRSDRIQKLLADVDIVHPYSKWQGAHWVLSLLAELHYPKGDEDLFSLRNEVYKWLFSEKHLKSIKTIEGKVRRCASQEGNAIYYSQVLGLMDERTDELIDRLLAFQWGDGGWNCDKNPKAYNSSYHESLIPFRALIRYLHDKQSQISTSRKTTIENAIYNAKEVFLKRELYLSLDRGTIINPNFILLHFPYYWRYNIMFALKVMHEGGFISDPRCDKALDLLELKELPSGGFPAEKRYYYSRTAKSGRTAVNWGGVNKYKMNEWVSSEAYYILSGCGRLNKQEKAKD
ncbi:MAG: hypothetical protein JW776_12170 [Candidatus Lokiarchaeota archaeon]|nr:hypothetical protein [Candidatus Lokiarchaeota archaeon]